MSFFWQKDVKIAALEAEAKVYARAYQDLVELLAALHGTRDLKKLHRELQRPEMEASWRASQAKEAERINKALESKGEKIRQARDRYKNELLKLERELKDTSVVKAKLEILNILLEGV